MADQRRALWDRQLIAEGHNIVRRCLRRNHPGPYQIQAAIDAVHSDEIDAEPDAYAGLSIRYERARIAAELHDVVAHAISMMVVQASAGQRLAGRDASRTAETFNIIAGAARHAEADLDRLAELLAEDASPDEGAHLGLLQQIVDTARASGLPVTLRVAGDTSSISSTVAHAGPDKEDGWSIHAWIPC